MTSSKNKTLLMWLLVSLCMAGIVLVWIPSFINTVWDFSDAVGEKGKVSHGAFFDNLKQIQAEFEKNVDKQKVTPNQQVSPPVVPLNEKELQGITKELELFTQAADKPIGILTPKQYCTRQGGKYIDREGSNGSSYGVCAFIDESECHALLFMRKKCHVGQYKSAEDGIPKWPDVLAAPTAIEYCRRINGTLTIVPRKEARGICINGMTVQNIGIAQSAASQLVVDEKRYAIPILKPQESFVVPSPIIIQKTIDFSSIRIELQTSFQEIDKENNTYHYAAKNK